MRRGTVASSIGCAMYVYQQVLVVLFASSFGVSCYFQFEPPLASGRLSQEVPVCSCSEGVGPSKSPEQRGPEESQTNTPS